jgi:hypothetical protein
MAVRPAADARPARWLLAPGIDWWDLVRFGPPGFETWVRIALPQDTEDPEPVDSVRAALVVLAGRTSTPTRAYAAVWEGWGGRSPAPPAPRVAVPHREMLLFTGTVEELRDAPGEAWDGSAEGSVPPHLAWPEDRAWCLACEVDEEIEFSVGCSAGTAQALVEELPVAVRRASYGEDAPMYRDED